MIRLEKQALAINAADVPGPDYRMDQSVKLSKAAIPVDVSNCISSALANISEGKLENLVINTHGSPGVIHLSSYEVLDFDSNNEPQKAKIAQYIGIHNIFIFNPFKGKIGTIWLTGCQIGSGEAFCSKLAMTAGCDVVAANVYQYVNTGLYMRLFPHNCIDDYEGVAYRWDSTGNKTVFSRKDWLGLDDTKQIWF
jgi:hypothetical protein